jgi:hypothetical protein
MAGRKLINGVSLRRKAETIFGIIIMAKNRIIYNGETYFSVPEAARTLRTNTTKIKKMMSEGILEWEQFEVNKRLWVSAKSIVEYHQSIVGK